MSGSASSGGPFEDDTLRSEPIPGNYPGGNREEGHIRALNHGVKWFLENYDEHGYDIVVKETKHVNTPVSSPGSADMWEDKGDVDLAFIDLDGRKEDFRAYEVKQDAYYEVKGENQNSNLGDSFDNCRDELEDFSWDMVATVELASNIPEDEKYPPLFRGGNIYGPEEALEKARNSERYRLLDQHVFDGSIRPAEENLLEPAGPVMMEDILNG